MRSRLALVGPPPFPGRTREQFSFLWGTAAIGILAGLALAGSSFGEGAVKRFPPCLFKFLTGIPCAGCGSTRAGLALAHLDLVAAFRWNPLFSAGVLFLLLGGLWAGILLLAGRPVPEPKHLPNWFRWASVAALAANWIFVILDGR